MSYPPRIPHNFQNLIKRYEAGETINGLADEIERNPKTLRAHFVRAGVAIRPTARVMLDTDAILAAHESGESVKAIAERLGISRNAIERRLADHGKKGRNRSEAMLVRMSRTTPEERRALVRKANIAATGRVPSVETLSLSAKTRQARQSTRTSDLEARFADMLRSAGVEFSQQFAVGPYNCDFMVSGVAVEVFGGQWHRHGEHSARAQKRTHYILDAGFHFYGIWCGAKEPITGEALNDLLAFLDLTRRDPSNVRQYRVVRGAGDLVASGCADDDYIAGVGSFKAS